MHKCHTLKEIADGVRAVRETINSGDELAEIAGSLKGASKIYTTGCGSSYWAAFILAEWLRGGGCDVQAVAASELYFEPYPESKDTLIAAFSQSGETTETIKAVKQAKENGAKVFSIINQEKSSMAGLSDHHYVTPAGDEHMLATKSFDSALAAAFIFAKSFTGNDSSDIKEIPGIYKEVMDLDISAAVDLLKNTDRAYALGIDGGYGAAGETAVKLGESALIQVTALPAPEVSHGPKANATGVPVILIAVQKRHEELFSGILKELESVGAKTLVYSPIDIAYAAKVNIHLPGSGDLAVFSAIKLSQRISVETALARGHDPDNPPGLKKFVKRDDL